MFLVRNWSALRGVEILKTQTDELFSWSFGDGEILARIGVPATREPKFLIPEAIRRMRTSVRGNDFWDCLG